MENKLAIIDLGTNTFHLLIISIKKNKEEIITKKLTPVKIGQNGISNGFITEEASQRALDTITDFHKEILAHNADQVFAFATSAFRSAKNGSQLANTILQKTGIEIKIIDGDTEAEYIYYGVKSGLKLPSKPCLIMDIGGGSVEFIISTEKSILWKHSFEIGAQRLVDLFHKNDPISQGEINSIEHFLDKKLKSLINMVKDFPLETLVGVAGTFDTLSDIYCASNEVTVQNPKSPPLSIDGYRLIHDELIKKNEKERLNIPGMLAMRVNMIVVASCLVNYVISKFDIKEIKVSSNSLKEGVLYLWKQKLLA